MPESRSEMLNDFEAVENTNGVPLTPSAVDDGPSGLAQEALDNRPLVDDMAAVCETACESSTPFGAIGTGADRDQAGRFVSGNRAALVVGARSQAFWDEVAGTRTTIARQVVSDAGFSDDDAPEALRRVADGIAQATLIRDSAFERLTESGGALTSTGRARRAFAVWVAAADRVERYARLIGLERRPHDAGLSITERIVRHGQRLAAQDAANAAAKKDDE